MKSVNNRGMLKGCRALYSCTSCCPTQIHLNEPLFHAAFPTAIPLDDCSFKGNPLEFGHFQGNIPGSSSEITTVMTATVALALSPFKCLVSQLHSTRDLQTLSPFYLRKLLYLIKKQRNRKEIFARSSSFATIQCRMADGRSDCAKIRLTFRFFFLLCSCLQTKNLLWLNCRSRFFYKLRL